MVDEHLTHALEASTVGRAAGGSQGSQGLRTVRWFCKDLLVWTQGPREDGR